MNYKIKSGDTLSKIARKFGLRSWRDIMRANRDTIKNPNRIRAGQIIKIPGSSKSSKQAKKFFDFSKAPVQNKSKLKKSISMNRVAKIAKSLAGYNNFKIAAKKAGYSLSFGYGSLKSNVWAHMDGNPTRNTRISIKINKQMFLDYGVNEIQQALDFIGELAKISSPGKELSVEFFKPVMEEFLGAWMSTTVAHELNHAQTLYENVPLENGAYKFMDVGEYERLSKPRNYDEEYARKAEVKQTNKAYSYVFKRISEMINRLEDVYGFSAKEQALVSGKMIKIWNDCVRETAEWFKTGPSHKFVNAGLPDGMFSPKLPSFEPRKPKPKPKPIPTYKSLLSKLLPAQQNFVNVQREQKGKETKMNKILEEYILKNTGENFEETPFGQIVADEVNKAVAEIPEIKLALEFLSEQDDQEIERDTQELGRTYARATLSKVKEEMISKLPEMVDKVLQDLLDGLEFDE